MLSHISISVNLPRENGSIWRYLIKVTLLKLMYSILQFCYSRNPMHCTCISRHLIHDLHIILYIHASHDQVVDLYLTMMSKMPDKRMVNKNKQYNL